MFPYLAGGLQNDIIFNGNWKDASNESYFVGFTTAAFKYHMNQIPFTWNYFKTEIKMIFVGGLVGVVSEKDKSLLPLFGYSVIEDKRNQIMNLSEILNF